MQTNYIIQTPVKNEENNLPNLIKSILEQSIKPILWLIIDDGSTDSTNKIIKEAQKNNSWIYSIRLESNKRDIGLHLSNVINKGLNFLIDVCEKNNIVYDFWGSIDADVTLEKTYFENLMKEFDKNHKLGIAGGGTWFYIDGKITHYNVDINEPSGGNMLVRKNYLKDFGFKIPITYSWDSVIKTKARIKGWQTKRFENIFSADSRYVNSAEGYWKGFFILGKGQNFINIHPIHALLKSINISKKYPYYIGFAYILGYVYSLVWIRTKIDDEEIKEYNWNKWRIKLNEILK